jgi:hypothetical protein
VIHSPKAREEALTQVVTTWKDPAAAQAAISSSKLDAKTQQTLIKTISAQ